MFYIKHTVALLLAAFFIFGAYGNAFPSQDIIRSYAGWGYPAFFHYVTALLEFSAAVLIALPRYRIVGSTLGALIMTAAIATLILHDAASRSVTAFVVLAACLSVLAISASSGFARTQTNARGALRSPRARILESDA